MKMVSCYLAQPQAALSCTCRQPNSISTAKTTILNFSKITQKTALRKLKLHCNSTSSGPTGPASGDNESRTILDAFFLGKALAEAVNERVESTVGEVLSALGRLQAEQQRQVQDFQEEVVERAQRAKEKAAREAVEAQGLITRSPTNKPAREATEAQGIVPKLATEGPSSASAATNKTENNSGLSSVEVAGSTTESPSFPDSVKDATVPNSDSDDEPAIRVSSDK